MDNKINQTLSFQAKMNISEISKNRARWSKIAKIFEKKTSNYPKDEFVFKERTFDNGFDFYINHANEKLNGNDVSTITPIVANILNLIPDEVVADKLKKLFLIQKKADKMEADYINFGKKYDICTDVKDETMDVFATAYYALKEKYINTMLEKDNVLKIPEGILIC